MSLKSFGSKIRSAMKFIDIGANLTDSMFQGIYNSSQKHPADYAQVLNRAWTGGLQKIIVTVGTVNDADEALRLANEDDIGANLTDSMFQGIYNSSQKHPADYAQVLNRAWTGGLQKIIVTVGTVNDADEALRLANEDDRLYITMGCHPTRCREFLADPDTYYAHLCKYIDENRTKVVAIGECGLDYDRLHFCEADTQRVYFEKQLTLAQKYQLPLFLHCRNAFDDFWEIVKRNSDTIQKTGGVVHSFDGTLEEAQKLIEFGFYIGINGCSLKTDAQLKTVAQIPAERILLETDCPWCGIRNSHAGSKLISTQFPVVKRKEKWTADSLIDGRYEPAQIVQVLEVVAAIHKADPVALAEQLYVNTMNLFFPTEAKNVY